MTIQGSGMSLLPTYSVMRSDLLRPVDTAMPDMGADLWLVAGVLKDSIVRGCYDALGRAFAALDWNRLIWVSSYPVLGIAELTSSPKT